MRVACMFIVAALGVAGAAGALGCVGNPNVTRVVDGRVVVGAYVEPEAYAAFLRGAMAEAAGDLPGALAAYEEAARIDDADPEIWTRIAAVRCRVSAGDMKARYAAARALAIDPDWGAAYAVRAQCEAARGEDRVEVERDARKAADEEPADVDAQVALAHAEGRRVEGDAARDRLVALTLRFARNAVAWEALAAWARSHGDALLAARAWSRAARLAPTSRPRIAREAVALAGDGEIAAARSLAGALLDARGDGDRTGGALTPEGAPAANPLVARLAVDDALAAGDEDAARRRAVQGHLPIDDVAGRALLLGQRRIARALAGELLAADAGPARAGARLVLAAIAWEEGDVAALGRAFDRAAPSGTSVDPVPASALLPFARAVAAASTPADARRVVDALAYEAFVDHDAVLVEAAVDLAASGALAPEALPADARVELAARSGRAPLGPGGPSLDALDARHRLLALAWTDAAGRDARAAVDHLATARWRDPLVTAAAARVGAASQPASSADLARRLSAFDPANALVVATALELARRVNDGATVGALRTHLRAVARTPKERADSL